MRPVHGEAIVVADINQSQRALKSSFVCRKFLFVQSQWHSTRRLQNNIQHSTPRSQQHSAGHSDGQNVVVISEWNATLDNRNVCSVDIITSNVTREECREECVLKTTKILLHRQLDLLKDGGRVMYLPWYIKFCCRRSGAEHPNFFLVYRVKVKRRMFYSFYRKFMRF